MKKKSVAFLYSKHNKRKLITQIIIGSESKYLGMKLTRGEEELYNENHEILLKGIKDTSKWKDHPC